MTVINVTSGRIATYEGYDWGYDAPPPTRPPGVGGVATGKVELKCIEGLCPLSD